jgi:hypothetical protein
MRISKRNPIHFASIALAVAIWITSGAAAGSTNSSNSPDGGSAGGAAASLILSEPGNPPSRIATRLAEAAPVTSGASGHASANEFDPSPAMIVPESSSAMLFLLGLIGLQSYSRRLKGLGEARD